MVLRAGVLRSPVFLAAVLHAVVFLAAVFLAPVLRAVLFFAVLLVGTVTTFLAAGAAFPFTMSLRVELATNRTPLDAGIATRRTHSVGYDRSLPLCGWD